MYVQGLQGRTKLEKRAISASAASEHRSAYASTFSKIIFVVKTNWCCKARSLSQIYTWCFCVWWYELIMIKKVLFFAGKMLVFCFFIPRPEFIVAPCTSDVLLPVSDTTRRNTYFRILPYICVYHGAWYAACVLISGKEKMGATPVRRFKWVQLCSRALVCIYILRSIMYLVLLFAVVVSIWVPAQSHFNGIAQVRVSRVRRTRLSAEYT